MIKRSPSAKNTMPAMRSSQSPRRGCVRVSCPTVPAKKPSKLNNTAACTVNTTPRAAIWPGTLPCAGMMNCGYDELREKRQEKQDDFRIDRIGQHALHEQAYRRLIIRANTGRLRAARIAQCADSQPK